MIKVIYPGFIKVVGQESGKVYAEGYRSNCFRKLNEKYPYKSRKGTHINRVSGNAVYPEPLVVVRL